MANVQAAASLFGSDDTEDPFATLGTERPTSNENHEVCPGSSVSQGGVEDSVSFFDEPTSSGLAAHPAGYENTDHQRGQRASSYSYEPVAQHTGYQTVSDVNRQQSFSYAYQPAPSTDYAAPMNSDYVAAAPSQYSYTPQTQAAPSSTYSYAPSTYAPATRNYMAQSSVPPAAKVPATQTLNRPKVTNAYDPPFPMVPARRAVSQGRQPAYNPYTPSSPPPPLPTSSQFTAQPSYPFHTPSSYHPQRPPSSASHFATQRPPSSASNSSQHAPPRPPSTASNFSVHGSLPPRPPSTASSHYSYSSRVSPPPPVPTYVPKQAVSLDTEWNNTRANDFDPEGGGDWETGDTENSGRTLTSFGSSSDAFHTEGLPAVTDTATNGYPYSSNPYQTMPAPTDKTASFRSTSPIGSRNTVEPMSLPSTEMPPPPVPNVTSPLPPLSGSAYSYRPSSSASMGRTTSPLSGQSTSTGRFRPASAAASQRPSPSTYQAPPLADPYAPRRQTSTGHTVDNVYNGGYSSKPLLNAVASPYAPSTTALPPPRNDEARNRSMSNGSTTSAASEDPYAPSHHSRKQMSETDYGSYTSRFDFPNTDASLGVQEVLVPVRAAYAPSPSLMGTNDPLGRSGKRIPVFSFGFGGKVVSCFHGASRMTAGFDVALSSRLSTGIDIRTLNTLIPESAFDTTVAFPGPLFGDSGTSPTIGLVRPGASTQAKNRKSKVILYLDERINEIKQGLGYLHDGTVEKRRADGKLILVKLLKVMVENEGRLSGTTEIDMAVRSALVPRLADMPEDNTAPGFIPLQRVGSLSGMSHMDSSDVISTTSLRASVLDKIQGFLLRGQRRQAYHYALDQQLWAHAMVIASGVDKEAWQEVVKEFIKTELGVKSDPARATLQVQGVKELTLSVNGREGLRAVYGLFSGQGAASVQDLVPQNLLSRATNSLPPPLPSLTPMTPNFPGASPSANIPPEALSNWAETVCMMLSTTITNEISSTLLCLGDQLYANHWVEAAHVCYLLSSQALPNGGVGHPPIGGVGHPAARMVLAGSRNPQSFPIFHKDPDALIFSEIIEFALSLPVPPKGSEPFAGLSHLQAYRFIRASNLIELGYISETHRYCEAISSSLARPSPFFNDNLIDQLKGLSDRLSGVAHSDKNSWIGGKIAKPSLDSIGGWLEGRFTKLVTGDVDSPGLPEEETAKPDGQGFSNAFSQYSTISSAAPSASPSPQSSVVNLLAINNTRPPDRSASALDNRRKQNYPPPRIASANAATTSFAQSYSLGHTLNNYQPMSTTSEATTSYKPGDDIGEDDPNSQVVTWWGDIDAHRTPTASNFLRAEDVSLIPTGDGFVSPMGNVPFSIPPQPTAQNSYNRVLEEDDKEDLGFGNSKSKSKVDDAPYDPGNAQEDEPVKKEEVQALGNNGNSSGSWFGRFFKKSDTPAPVKASLGEETSFYYDKELKKWINKKSGGEEAAKAPPPPPPSRPQTASPGMTGPRQTLNTPSVGPPPARSASAMDITSPPMRSVPRVRSNLAPTPEAESVPPTPPPPSTTPGLAPPPSPMPGRPKSSASKRNVRNRYVDVFAQPGPGAA